MKFVDRAGSKVASKTRSNGRGGMSRRATEVTTEVLLGRLRRRSSDEIRNELVERHRGHVEAMARALSARLPRSVDVDDLVHAGLWGLMRAIENFDPDRGGEFLPFMRPRVRGAMLDELRTMDFLPRLYRQRLRERESAALRLRERLCREPSDSEIAAELGVSEARLRQSYVAPPDRLRADSQRDPGADGIDSLPDDDLESPIDAQNRQDLLAKIEQSLQPIEWTVLRMHYLEGMSGKEVARKLRLSAARICQIHVRVLSRLKNRLSSAAL
jgi:RNA polymerase sigma factor for flagellar operon FliA